MGDWQEQDWSNYNQNTDWNNSGQVREEQGEDSYRSGVILLLFQHQDFQQFDYGQTSSVGGDQRGFMAQDSPYTGQMFVPDSQPPPSYGGHAGQTDGFEDEPPLLEELGINPDHIMQKTLTVLNPLRATDVS